MKLAPATFAALAIAAATVLGAGQVHAGSAFVSQNGGALSAVPETGTSVNPYLLGILDNQPSSLFTTLSTAGSFIEYATFTIPVTSVGTTGGSGAYSLNVTLPGGGSVTVGSISSLTLTVFTGTPALPGAAVAGPYAGGTSFNAPALAAGNYFLQFAGSVTGVGGQYSASVQTSPVPEAGTYMMMLAGIGAMGLMVWRRREPNH